MRLPSTIDTRGGKGLPNPMTDVTSALRALQVAELQGPSHSRLGRQASGTIRIVRPHASVEGPARIGNHTSLASFLGSMCRLIATLSANLLGRFSGLRRSADDRALDVLEHSTLRLPPN